MSAATTVIPLVPEPLVPLKEKPTGTNGRGLECPPAWFVGSGGREPSGTNGNHRDGLNGQADAIAWSDADMARFLERRARLLRWGWLEPDAEALAERLVHRDRSGDDRQACVECRHYRPGRCANHRAAGLQADAIGRELAALLQHCAGFAPVASRSLATGRTYEDTAP